jgi:hypothetical protein
VISLSLGILLSVSACCRFILRRWSTPTS